MYRREGRNPRCRKRISNRKRVEAELQGAGALRQAETLDYRGMQLSGMPDNLAVDHDLGTTPRMPRQFLACAQR
ncbi:Uncharacterised protein [Mycobacteroides abscessus subsp. abscessus]|nr:Uncharacterised protein [Mycobacteroides abscessus subsp. abscessus]SKV52628.1 Uncharacterised protein [Mycobacteroides abscessus subsp. abscessus]